MSISGAARVSRGQAIAYRLDRHHLAARLPPGSLREAAGACGIQNTPPGSAALALHARVEGLEPDDVARAVVADKTLLQAMSLRGAPHFFPAADAAVFTAGLLPEDEDSLRFFVRGAVPGLDRVGMSATELVDRTAAATLEVLDGRAMTKDRLGVAIGDLIAGRLSPGQRDMWRSASWFVPGQFLGESLVRYALYVVSLRGLLCYAARKDDQACFTRTDQWLGVPPPAVNVADVRAGLVRRYLRCYGPSTAQHYAQWAGIAPAQAARAWALVKGEVAEVDFEGRRAWALAEDVPRLRSPPAARGVRFLPPHEPLLQLRDRGTLVPDAALHCKLWRTVGNPGVLLVDGSAVAAWRSRKSGKRMTISVEPFAAIPQKMRREIASEAELLGPHSGCTSVIVKYK